MITYQPRMMSVLEGVISKHHAATFALKKLEDYLSPGAPVPESISFFEARHIGQLSGDTVIGWSNRQDMPLDAEVGQEWQINPLNKTVARAWSKDEDMLVVLTSHSATPILAPRGAL